MLTKPNGRVSLDQGNCANRLDRVAHDPCDIFFVISVLFVHTYKLKTQKQWDRTNTFQKTNKLNYVSVFSISTVNSILNTTTVQ